jgi:predicted HicB family RNase H-like nuclease
MISATIIIASVVLALAYVVVWLVNPKFRQQIEQPKYWFQDQLEKYDHECRQALTEQRKPDAD